MHNTARNTPIPFELVSLPLAWSIHERTVPETPITFRLASMTLDTMCGRLTSRLARITFGTMCGRQRASWRTACSGDPLSWATSSRSLSMVSSAAPSACSGTQAASTARRNRSGTPPLQKKEYITITEEVRNNRHIFIAQSSAGITLFHSNMLSVINRPLKFFFVQHPRTHSLAMGLVVSASESVHFISFVDLLPTGIPNDMRIRQLKAR